jgi:hypothetical protein
MKDYFKNCCKYFIKYLRILKVFRSTFDDEAEGNSQIWLYINAEFHVSLEFIKRDERSLLSSYILHFETRNVFLMPVAAQCVKRSF